MKNAIVMASTVALISCVQPVCAEGLPEQENDVREQLARVTAENNALRAQHEKDLRINVQHWTAAALRASQERAYIRDLERELSRVTGRSVVSQVVYDPDQIGCEVNPVPMRSSGVVYSQGETSCATGACRFAK